MTEVEDFSVDKDDLIKVSKPIFYGFIFLAGVSMTVSPSYAGTLMGVAVMAAITFVAAGLSEVLNKDWEKFVHIIALITLLSSILAAGYISSSLAFLG